MDYENVLGERKFPTYEQLKTGLLQLIDEGKISREDASRLLPELRESEDERVRKAIISLVHENSSVYKSFAGIDLCDMLAWLEKQKEQKPIPDWMPKFLDELRSKKNYFDWDEHRDLEGQILAIINWIAPNYFNRKEQNQKPAEKQDYSGLNDLERAIHRGFISAGVENVSITIIKETAWECLAQMNPAEWNDTDMREARDSLISVCRDWECGKQTTLLPIAAVRARYFLEHLTEPKPAEWSEEDETRMVNIIIMLEEYLVHHYSKDDIDKSVAWLKSLRPQPQGTYKLIVHNIYEMLKDKDFFDITPSHRVSLLNDIRVRCKNADEQAEILDVPSWKPSEEQISSLKQARDYYMSGRVKYVGRHLSEIAEQLEKLM